MLGERGLAGYRGHTMPMRDTRLKSPAFAAKTAGAMRSIGRTGETRPGLGLRGSSCPRPARYERTSRNVTAEVI